MEEEHSFATKGVVRPVWSPSEAAVEREARRRSHYYTYVNFWPFASVMLALLFLLIGDPAPDVHLPPPVDLPAGFHTTAQTKALAGREEGLSGGRCSSEVWRCGGGSGRDRQGRDSRDLHSGVQNGEVDYLAASFALTGRARGAATLRP